MELYLLFIAIITNAGGEGKTMLSSALAAILRLLGQSEIIILDGDQGNWASSVFNKDASRLGWSVEPAKAVVIADTFDGKHVILDPGANAFAGSATFMRTTRKLGDVFKSRGYRVISLHPVSTNKAGALESMVELAEDFGDFEQIMTLVNRDGSGHFIGDQSRFNGKPTIRVGHLSPGLMEVAQHYDMDLCRAILEPAEEYTLAGRFICQWLANIAAELEAANVLPEGAGQAIRRLSETPPPVVIRCVTAADCTDAVLRQKIMVVPIATFLSNRNFSRASLLEAADKFYPQG